MLEKSAIPQFLIRHVPPDTEGFVNRATTPLRWYKQAGTMWRAAEVVWQEHLRENAAMDAQFGKPLPPPEEQPKIYFVDEPAMLLAGYAIENLLAALIVMKDPGVFAGGRLRLKGKPHDLVLLASKAGIQVDERETHVLEYLTHHIRWAGRYHVPGRKDEHSVTLSASQDAFDQFTALFWRLVGCVSTAMSGGKAHGVSADSTVPTPGAKKPTEHMDPPPRPNMIAIKPGDRVSLRF